MLREPAWLTDRTEYSARPAGCLIILKSYQGILLLCITGEVIREHEDRREELSKSESRPDGRATAGRDCGVDGQGLYRYRRAAG